VGLGFPLTGANIGARLWEAGKLRGEGHHLLLGGFEWNDHELAAFFGSMGFEPATRLVLETEISPA